MLPKTELEISQLINNLAVECSKLHSDIQLNYSETKKIIDTYYTLNPLVKNKMSFFKKELLSRIDDIKNNKVKPFTKDELYKIR